MILLCRAFRELVLAPKYTSPTADARIAFAYTFPLARKGVLFRAYRKYSFLTWVPDAVMCVFVHRVRYWTNFAIVGSKINTRRDLLVVLRQKTQSRLNLFTFSLHALGLISLDSENSNSTASTLNGFDGARLLDRVTDIVTGESNESHFTASIVALLPHPPKVAPTSCRLSRRQLASARVGRSSQLLELLQKKAIDILY